MPNTKYLKTKRKFQLIKVLLEGVGSGVLLLNIAHKITTMHHCVNKSVGVSHNLKEKLVRRLLPLFFRFLLVIVDVVDNLRYSPS